MGNKDAFSNALGSRYLQKWLDLSRWEACQVLVLRGGNLGAEHLESSSKQVSQGDASSQQPLSDVLAADLRIVFCSRSPNVSPSESFFPPKTSSQA